MLTRLEYTVKIATNKFHELQDLGDKIQTNMASMFKQHFKELTPDPEAEDDTDSIHTTPYKNFASIGHVRISERKCNIQEKSAASSRNKANSNNQEKLIIPVLSGTKMERIILIVKEPITMMHTPFSRQA